jgi:hypothetical protein
MPYIGGASPDSQVGTSAAYRSQSYTSTASQTTFTVDGGYTPGFIEVYVNGIKQVNGVDVTATNGTTVVFASALPAGYTVEVQALRNIAVNATSLPVSSIAFSDGTVLNSAWGSVSYLQYTGNGTQTAYSTTPYSASSVNYTSVYISGVYQRKNTYSWAGSTLTFTSAPPNGAAIEIVINFQTTQVGVPSYGTVTPNSLSTGGPYWDSSGNVGVGTSSPSYNLEIYSSGAFLAGVTRATTSTDAGAIFSFSTLNASSAKTSMADIVGASSTTTAGAENGYMSLRTKTSGSMTEKVRIDSSGNLLVGTLSNSTGYRLVVDSSGIGSGGIHGLLYSSNEFNFAKNLGSTSDIYINYRATAGAFTVSGYRFLNAGPSTYVPLYASAFTVSSDYRLKKNVQKMSGGLEFVNKLRPITFEWIETGESMDGFIAHEVQEIAPYAVHGEKDAVDPEKGIIPQGLDSAKLVARLVAALQELSQKVDAQASEINKLKSALNGV